MWWNYEVKAAVRRKEDTWKEELTASDEKARGRCMEVYREEKRKLKRCIYQSKMEVNEQFGRRTNQYVTGNMKLFLKG